MTLASALKTARMKLTGHSDAPLLDAQRLLQQVTNHPEVSYFLAHGEEVLSTKQASAFMALVSRREKGEPLAYILGHWEWYGRAFQVTPHVLIPRPATENLIETALPIIKQLSHQAGRPITLADIGTGSGCIAITLLLEASDYIARVYATDNSEAALHVAQTNATQHGVADRIQFVAGNLFEPLVNINIDLIVSNPPYVPAAELHDRTSIEKRGLAYEPRQALDGGADGQDSIKKLRAIGLPMIIEGTHGLVSTVHIEKK